MATLRCWVCGRTLRGMYATKVRGKRVCNNFGLAQFLMENGLSETQVKMNLDAAVKQLKKNKNLSKQLN